MLSSNFKVASPKSPYSFPSLFHSVIHVVTI